MRSYSSSSSNAFPLKIYLLQIICRSVYLISVISYSNGFNFNPTIQLPTNALYRNASTITTCPRTLLLNIDDFGAKGDGLTDDTKSFREVWTAACSSHSPRAKIIIPKLKIYLIHPTDFVGPCKSKVTLRVSGFIDAPRDPEVWEGLDEHKWLYFQGVNRLKIEGRGVIDGNGREWWARSCKKNHSNPCTHAPTAVTFHKCKNLKIRNITVVNSQQMHVAFTHCKGVEASGVILMSPAESPNTDGVHISASTNVELDNILISTGDDCISIVGNSSAIRMRNIFCRVGHGISIGSLGKHNSSAVVEDVTVNRAFFFDTKNGVRIKTWQGGSGVVRKVVFKNIWMSNVSNPIIIDQYYCDSPVTCLNQTSSVRIDNISFIGIRGTSATEEAIKFECSDNYPCKRLYLENIELTTLNGIDAKSFCWEAYGKSSGSVYPPSCVTSGDIIIRHQIKFNSTSWHNDQYALS